jgi:hypothetical protein
MISSDESPEGVGNAARFWKIEGSGEKEWQRRTKPNNSFNASGISSDVIHMIEGFSQYFPPR